MSAREGGADVPFCDFCFRFGVPFLGTRSLILGLETDSIRLADETGPATNVKMWAHDAVCCGS
jgi:hypothetical protein